MEPEKLKYRPDIDGMRGIAILFVIIYHAFPAIMPGGFIGVDIFFVISGFLISTIIFRGLKQGTFTFREFYIRRINRIFPALIAVLLFCLVFGWFALLPNEYAVLGKHVAFGSGFLSNLAFYWEAGYFDILKDYKPLLHLWSIGIEEQFYLTIPFLLFLLWKWTRRSLVYIAILFIISFLSNILLINNSPSAVFYLPFVRFWELIMGILLAYSLIYLPNRVNDKPGAWLGWLGVVAIIAGASFINENSVFPGWWALLPTFGALLLIWSGPQAWLNRKVLSNKPLVFVGLISYPLYLWHWPLLSFANIAEIDTQKIRLVLVGISAILAWLTYRFIERPIRLGSQKSRKAVILLILMVFIFFGGSIVVQGDGFASRYKSVNELTEDNVKRLIEYNIQQLKGLSLQKDDTCMQFVKDNLGKSNLDYCRLNNIGGNETVALIGDSHAGAIFTGLAEELKKSGRNLLLLGTGGCPTFHNVVAGADKNDRKLCGEKTEEILRLIQMRQEIKFVVLATRGQRYLEGEEAVTLDYNSVSPQNSPQIFSQGLSDTVSLLKKSGKTTFYILEVPGSKIHPRNCINSSNLLSFGESTCTVDKRDILIERLVSREIVASIPDLTIIDPFLFLCASNNCPAFDKGRLLYSDNHHLSPYGSEFLAPYIMRYIKNR